MTFGLLMSLNRLIETQGGFDYTAADCIGWLREAGFRETAGERLAAEAALGRVRAKLAEAPSFGKPIVLYDVQSVGAKSYLAVAQELISRVEQGTPPSPSLPAVESLPTPEVPA